MLKEDVMRKFTIFFVLIILVSFGCKQRAITQPEAQPPQPQKQQKAEEARPQKPAEEEGAQKGAVVEKSEIKSEEEAEAEAAGKEGLFKDIHFDFDKYSIQDSYTGELKSIAAWMRKHSDAKLSIEGHCDDRGTNEYNLALGDRRAKAVKDYLVSLGVPSSRVETISYGEEKPLCTEQTEECWARNRRAHFVVLK
jgi:peptidoglycan-associated lipoprotein